MTEEEFRAGILAGTASRAETTLCGLREAFVEEVLERLREAGEIPDAELCSEALIGQRGRKLEIDAFAFDDADDSIHLFVALRDGSGPVPPVLALGEAREQGFNRLIGVFEQAREGWLAANIEESRPLWSLARRIEQERRPAALRLHVLSDRSISERVREIQGDVTKEHIPITFQIWDATRLKRIHEARNARDDLVVDFSDVPQGGLAVLPAAVGSAGYDAYLAVVPAQALADIYIRHGSRLLEGNVRTFLGRRGNVNKGIAATLAKEPEKFFAYNNGIATTASAVSTARAEDGTLLLTSATDLQIVNGAQTTATLASAQRERNISLAGVFVPMKLSVVAPELVGRMIPRISRFANSQNAVRASDFFANHEFHRRVQEISRRLLAPSAGTSQVPTYWYYERARGQHLNDQAMLTAAKKQQFIRLNPRQQVITKTDLAKVENCFALLPDVACKGAEKSFTEFAERVTKDWEDEGKRALYGDGWFKAAVARVILFQAAERLVSNASWYEGGYRAQIVAYTLARLARLAGERSGGGSIDYLRIWTAQSVGDVMERQMLAIGEAMATVLRNPPQAGQNISEWAKQQACRKRALETEVPIVERFDRLLCSTDDIRVEQKEAKAEGCIDRGLEVVTEVMNGGASFWEDVRDYARHHKLLLLDDERALVPAVSMPKMIPTDRQAARLIGLLHRCREEGFEG
jgi:hypothetical protein